MAFVVGVFIMRTALLLKEAVADNEHWHTMALKMKLSGWGSVSISGSELECFWLASSGFAPSLSISLPPYPTQPPLPPYTPFTDIFSSAVLLRCVVRAISWGCLKISMDFSLLTWPHFLFSCLAASPVPPGQVQPVVYYTDNDVIP